MESFDRHLTLHRALQICRAHKASLATLEKQHSPGHPRPSSWWHQEEGRPRPSSWWHGESCHHTREPLLDASTAVTVSTVPRGQCNKVPGRHQACSQQWHCDQRGHIMLQQSAARKRNTPPSSQPALAICLFTRTAEQIDHLVKVDITINGTTYLNTRLLPDSAAGSDAMSALSLRSWQLCTQTVI